MPRRQLNSQTLHHTPMGKGAVLNQSEFRAMVLTALVEDLDLSSFLYDPQTRLQLREVMESLSDEEFGRFERRFSKKHLPN